MGKWGRTVGLAAVVAGVLVPAAAAAARSMWHSGTRTPRASAHACSTAKKASCSRSPDAYGPKVAAAKGYTLSFQACSGAKSTEVNANSSARCAARTSARDDHDRRQRRRLQQRDHQLRAVLLHVRQRDQRSEQLHRQQTARVLDTTYSDIRAKATTAHVIALGYPHLFTAEGKTCNVNFLTSSNEKKLNETGDKLDAVDQSPRRSPRLHVRRPAERVLLARGLLVLGVAQRPVQPARESYHPNVSGQSDFTTRGRGRAALAAGRARPRAAAAGGALWPSTLQRSVRICSAERSPAPDSSRRPLPYHGGHASFGLSPNQPGKRQKSPANGRVIDLTTMGAGKPEKALLGREMFPLSFLATYRRGSIRS